MCSAGEASSKPWDLRICYLLQKLTMLAQCSKHMVHCKQNFGTVDWTLIESVVDVNSSESHAWGHESIAGLVSLVVFVLFFSLHVAKNMRTETTQSANNAMKAKGTVFMHTIRLGVHRVMIWKQQILILLNYRPKSLQLTSTMDRENKLNMFLQYSGVEFSTRNKTNIKYTIYFHECLGTKMRGPFVPQQRLELLWSFILPSWQKERQMFGGIFITFQGALRHVKTNKTRASEGSEVDP